VRVETRIRSPGLETTVIQTVVDLPSTPTRGRLSEIGVATPARRRFGMSPTGVHVDYTSPFATTGRGDPPSPFVISTTVNNFGSSTPPHTPTASRTRPAPQTPGATPCVPQQANHVPSPPPAPAAHSSSHDGKKVNPEGKKVRKPAKPPGVSPQCILYLGYRGRLYTFEYHVNLYPGTSIPMPHQLIPRSSTRRKYYIVFRGKRVGIFISW
jgi:hypothetical protein